MKKVFQVGDKVQVNSNLDPTRVLWGLDGAGEMSRCSDSKLSFEVVEVYSNGVRLNTADRGCATNYAFHLDSIDHFIPPSSSSAFPVLFGSTIALLGLAGFQHLAQSKKVHKHSARQSQPQTKGN